MKKPTTAFQKCFIAIWLIVWPVLLFVFKDKITFGKEIDWKTIVLVIGMALYLFVPLGMIGIIDKKGNNYSEWLWENRKDDVQKATILLALSKKLDDLLTPSDKRYTFHVTFKDNGTHDVTLKAGDADMPFMISKLVDCPQVRDAHIKKTVIIAVNNQQITDTQQRISIAGALVGGLIAGAPGAMLGGLRGSTSYTYDKPGSNYYTFLIVFDDGRPNETERVQEVSSRFKFLITKLDVG